jgi:hypothetical protein
MHRRGLVGLPYSILVGSDGTVCAAHRAQLSAEAVKRMKDTCQR